MSTHPAARPRRLAVLGLISAAALAAGAGAFAVRTAAPPLPKYEYARIAADGETYVLVTAGAIYRVDLGPTPFLPEAPIVQGNLKLSQNALDRKLAALNVFAAEGWEIEPGTELTDGKWYLTRRRR